jgi:hypothetical protein
MLAMAAAMVHAHSAQAQQFQFPTTMPVLPTRAATISYWNALAGAHREILPRFEKAGQAKDLDKAASALESLARQITSISTHAVDPDLADWAHELAAHYRRGANLLRRADKLQNDAAANLFLGILFDLIILDGQPAFGPLAAVNAVREVQALQRDAEAWVDRLEQLQNRGATIRNQLQRRYNLEW